MTSPTVLVVEHEDECPPALVGDWLTEAGCILEICRPYKGDEVPTLAPYDGLLILGGPMGAHDDELYPWLRPVKQRVREARAARLPTLGICLGHQLIAVALGGLVEKNRYGQQLGLLGVGWTDAAGTDVLMAPLATPRRGVQWNDDVVTALPDGATLLAATGRDEVQVARYGPSMWGVQLHPEVDVAVLLPWAESDRGSHEARGVDQAALLRDIGAARAELDDAWRPLASRFAALAAEYVGRAR